MTATMLEPALRRPSLRRVLTNETVEELFAVVREPTTLFFSVAMPVGFFALFASLFGGEQVGSTTATTTMLATFGAFGVVGVYLLGATWDDKNARIASASPARRCNLAVSWR
jgi:ABC-2 type transport system permease protein